MPRNSGFLNKFLPVFCIGVYILAATLGAFTGGIWAVFGIALAVFLFFSVWISDRRIILPSRTFALFTLAALIVFALELPLSSHFDLSIKMWVRLLSIFIPLLLLTAPRLQTYAYSRNFIPFVALAMAIGAMTLGLELQSDGAFLHLLKQPASSLTEYNRGIAHLVILSFPIFAGLWIAGGKKAALVLAALLLFPASLTESHTAKLALMIGMLCIVAASFRPVWTRKLLAASCAIILGWPFYAQYVFANDYPAVTKLHNSWRHRMEIWDFLSYRIEEQPFFGWGLGTTHSLDFITPHGDLYRFATQPAPHAHNFITQLWVETGLPGLALGFGLMLLTLRTIGKMHVSLQPFALGGFAAAVTVAMFGFDFWTDALWAAFALSAFAFGMLQQNIERGQHTLHA